MQRACRVVVALSLLGLALSGACGKSSTPTTPTTPTQPAQQAPAATRIIGISGSLVFGSVNIGDTPTNTFTISNTGNAVLTFTGITASGGTGTAGLTASPQSATVPAGGSVTVALKFSPTIAQVYSATVTVVADQTSGSNSVAFSGTGVTVAPTGPATSFGNGQYTVGSNVASGRYFSAPPSGCYFERQSGFSGSLNDILANEFLSFAAGQWIVEVKASDKGFKSDGCGTWNQSAKGGAKATITPGMWLIGSQIGAGTWRAPNNTGGCYWERLRDFSNELNGIITNDFVSSAGQVIVTISGGDVGFDANGSCGTWTLQSGDVATSDTPRSGLSTVENRDLARATGKRR